MRSSTMGRDSFHLLSMAVTSGHTVEIKLWNWSRSCDELEAFRMIISCIRPIHCRCLLLGWQPRYRCEAHCVQEGRKSIGLASSRSRSTRCSKHQYRCSTRLRAPERTSPFTAQCWHHCFERNVPCHLVMLATDSTAHRTAAIDRDLVSLATS